MPRCCERSQIATRHALSTLLFAWEAVDGYGLRPFRPLNHARRAVLEVGAPPGTARQRRTATRRQQSVVMVTAEVHGWEITRGR